MSNAAAIVAGRLRVAPAGVRPGAEPPSVTSAGGAGTGGGRPRRVLRGLGRLVMNLVLVASLLVFVFLAVGPHVLGYRTSTMLSGSMEPGISPGDVVVTVERPAADVQVGDVISYRIPIEDHHVETHRVTKVHVAKDGTISIRTKGDANSFVDPWTAILLDDTVWEVQTVVPKLGHVIRALRTPVVHDVVLWVAVGGLVLLGLTTIWGRSDDDGTGGSDPDADEPVTS